MIEGTGLADPSPILSTPRAYPVLKHHVRLGDVVATVDAVNASAQCDAHDECANQIAAADHLILTKTDLGSAEQIEAAIARAAQINPYARIAGSDAARAAPAHAEERHAGIQAFALTFAEPIDWTMFGIWSTMPLDRHGASVPRLKGILNPRDSDTPIAIHGVRLLAHRPVHTSARVDDSRKSRIVFIVEGLPRPAIERSPRVFLAMAR